MEFRCAEVTKQSAPAAAAAAAAADASRVEVAAPAPSSVTVAAAATATTHVVSAAGTSLSIQELTASNGDVNAQHQQMQQTRRHCGMRCSVNRISCDIGRDRCSSRSKELRVAVLCISRHSDCRGVIEFRRASFVVDLSGLCRAPITQRAIGNSSLRGQWATLSTGCSRGHHLTRQGLRPNPFGWGA